MGSPIGQPLRIGGAIEKIAVYGCNERIAPRRGRAVQKAIQSHGFGLYGKAFRDIGQRKAFIGLANPIGKASRIGRPIEITRIKL